jgi:hypothetical protein
VNRFNVMKCVLRLWQFQFHQFKTYSFLWPVFILHRPSYSAVTRMGWLQNSLCFTNLNCDRLFPFHATFDFLFFVISLVHFYWLFDDDFGSAGYVTSHSRIEDELERIWKEALLWNLCRRMKKTTKSLSRGRWCPSWNLNWALLRFKSRLFLLDNPVWFSWLIHQFGQL